MLTPRPLPAPLEESPPAVAFPALPVEEARTALAPPDVEEWADRAGDAERAALYQRAGDRFLEEEHDPEAALSRRLTRRSEPGGCRTVTRNASGAAAVSQGTRSPPVLLGLGARVQVSRSPALPQTEDPGSMLGRARPYERDSA